MGIEHNNSTTLLCNCGSSSVIIYTYMYICMYTCVCVCSAANGDGCANVKIEELVEFNVTVTMESCVNKPTRYARFLLD